MPEDASKNRWWTTSCVAGLVLGLLVIAVGIAWPKVVTPAMVWSPEQAEELKRAGDAFHAAREQNRVVDGNNPAPGANGTATPRELAEKRYNRLKADLEAAQMVRTHWGQRVVAAGFGLTIVGGLGYLAARGS